MSVKQAAFFLPYLTREGAYTKPIPDCRQRHSMMLAAGHTRRAAYI
jgi:hypothetical protein